MTLLYHLVTFSGALALTAILFHAINVIEHPRRGKRERRGSM